MNLDTKIEVSVGCVDFLTNEVENLRKINEKLAGENSLIHRFLTLTESISHRGQSIGYGHDQMYDAKREIREAIEKAKNKPKPEVSGKISAE